jgi:polar amino acid transport system substrate-binding protein
MKKTILIFLLFILPSTALAQKETTFDRVIETKTIKCAYALRPPLVTRDVNSKKMTGAAVDLTEEIGKRLGLKIDWAEEVGFGTIIESIKTRRADMGCGVYVANSARASHVGFTKPIYFETLYIYKRKDDPRTIETFDELNDPKYSFSSIDGGSPIVLQRQLFPLSKEKTLPELSDLSDTFEDLVTKKVDFVIQAEMTVVNFEKARPGLITKLVDKPVAYWPMVLLLPLGDVKLKSMIDTVLTEIEYDGTLEKILRHHNLDKLMKRNPMPESF